MKYIYWLLGRIRNFILSLPGYKNISDFNTNLMSISIPGFLHPGNLYCFDYAINNLPSDSPVVEIGSFSGLSTNIISYYLRLHNRANKVICADPWNIPLESGVSRCDNPLVISEKQLRNFIKSNFIKSINEFSKNNLPYLVESYSNDFFESWKKGQTVKDVLKRKVELTGKISFCYIDGDHSYKQTKEDFKNVNKLLEVGGFILFDDSAPYETHECARFMKDILKNKRYKLVVKNPNYLFQKIT